MQILTEGPQKGVSCDLRFLRHLFEPIGLNDLYIGVLNNLYLKTGETVGRSPLIQPISSWHTLNKSVHLTMSNTQVFMGSAISRVFQECMPQTHVNKQYYVNSV